MKIIKNLIVILVIVGAAVGAAWWTGYLDLAIEQVAGSKEQEPAESADSEAEVENVPDAPVDVSNHYTKAEIKWLKANFRKPFRMAAPARDSFVNPGKVHLRKGYYKFARLSEEKADKLRYEVTLAVPDKGTLDIAKVRFGGELNGETVYTKLFQFLKPPRKTAAPKSNTSGFGTAIEGPTASEIKAQVEKILRSNKLLVTPVL